MATKEELKATWEAAELERARVEDEAARYLAESIVLPVPDVETTYRYDVDGPVVEERGGDRYKVERIIVSVSTPDEGEDEPYIDVTMRGTKLKKDGTPDTRAGKGAQYIGDWVTSQAFKAAFLKTVGGG